jgi:tape measure domain-containing protein
MADTRYNVVIALHMPTGDVTKGAAEASRILDRLAADELSRSKKLSASQLREIQRGHRDQQREHSRAARQAASEYEKQLGSGFFSKLARAATRSFRDGFKIGGESFGGGGGLIGGALSVAGGSILTSVLGGVTSQITGAVKAGFDFNKLKEQSLLAFEIKLKGKKEAQDFFNQVAKFAEDTPLELDQALTSVQKLMVAFTAPEALRSMRAITDEVAKQGKVGGEAQESINGIGLQLQQILLKGKLQQEELVSLAERQINVYGFLTKKLASENADFARLGVEQQKEQLNEMVRRGEIDARAAVGAIVMGMEEEAGGTAARIARETAEGMESNIKDSLNRTAGVASESAFKEYKKFLDLTLDFLNTGAAERIAGNISATTGGLFAGLEKTLSAISSGNLGQLGLDAATSAAEGVQSGAKGLYNAGAGAAGEVERGWRDRLEQHSPSAVMQRLGFEAGASLLTGFIQGATQQGESVAEYYRRLAQDPRIRAWFEMLRQVEGGAPRTVVGGRQFPEGLREHPGSIGMGMMGPKGWSTAAGNWQITQTNWRRLAPTLGLNNFSDVDQQMIAALALFGEQGGIQSLLSGDLRGALRASQPWAGSPLSTLPGRKPLNAEQFIARYQQSLGGGDLTGGIGRFSTGPVDLEVSRLQGDCGVRP